MPYTRWRPVSQMAGAHAHPAGPGPVTLRAGRREPALAPLAPVAGASRAARAGHRWSGSWSTRPTRTTTRYYSLLWGRELLHGARRPSTATARPTEHPLAIVFGALLSLLGRRRRPRDGRRHPRARSCVLVAGLYRLGARVVHAARRARRRGRCSARASTSRSSPRAATSTSRTWRFVVWAAVLEAERPRRGTPVLRPARPAPGCCAPRRGCSAALYFLWLASPRAPPGRARVKYAALAGAAPVVWVAHRLRRHRRPAVLAAPHERPGRGARAHQRRLSEVPSATVQLPQGPRQGAGLLAALVGLVLARGPRAAARARCRSRCWSSGLGTFVLVGLAGLSVIDRYLLVPSLVVMVFAAVALGGWTMLRAGRGAHGVGDRVAWRSSSTAWPSRPRASTSRPSPTSCPSAATRTRRCARCSTTRRCAPRCAAGRCRRPTTS